MNTIKIIIIALLLSIFAYSDKNPKIIGGSVVYIVEDEEWIDINEYIKTAIKNKGIVISHTTYVKNMLERTVKDVGAKQTVYVNAEVHLFCQSTLSHEMTSINPHIISHCPYSIAVYELKNKKNTIYVSYQKHPNMDKAYEGVIKLQESIIRDALEL